MLEPAVQGTVGVLQAAHKYAPSVKRVVVTGRCVVAYSQPVGSGDLIKRSALRPSLIRVYSLDLLARSTPRRVSIFLYLSDVVSLIVGQTGILLPGTRHSREIKAQRIRAVRSLRKRRRGSSWRVRNRGLILLLFVRTFVNTCLASRLDLWRYGCRRDIADMPAGP